MRDVCDSPPGCRYMPANERHWPNIGSMSRVCWWDNIAAMMAQRLPQRLNFDPNLCVWLIQFTSSVTSTGLLIILTATRGAWSIYSKQTRDFHPIMFLCWASVVDDGPTLNECWVYVSLLLAWPWQALIKLTIILVCFLLLWVSTITIWINV